MKWASGKKVERNSDETWVWRVRLSTAEAKDYAVITGVEVLGMQSMSTDLGLSVQVWTDSNATTANFGDVGKNHARSRRSGNTSRVPSDATKDVFVGKDVRNAGKEKRHGE